MINRVYREKIVSDMTLDEVEAIIQNDDIQYSGDYGFKVKDDVILRFSLN